MDSAQLLTDPFSAPAKCSPPYLWCRTLLGKGSSIYYPAGPNNRVQFSHATNLECRSNEYICRGLNYSIYKLLSVNSYDCSWDDCFQSVAYFSHSKEVKRFHILMLVICIITQSSAGSESTRNVFFLSLQAQVLICNIKRWAFFVSFIN